jgi:uncharacterized protein YdaU (DUF1376 family)
MNALTVKSINGDRFFMNYYEHHIGDYAEATSHLTFVEDAAYSRLIRKYYATEKPLPSDVKHVQRLINARTRDERNAVALVLNEFFILKDDGWHQARCDHEIARYKDKQSKAKRSAETRWNSAMPDARKNSIESDFDKACERIPNAMQTECSPVTSNQSPETSNQTPYTSHQSNKSTEQGAKSIIEDGLGIARELVTKVKLSPIAQEERHHCLITMMKKECQVTPMDDSRIKEMVLMEVSDAELEAAIKTAKEVRAKVNNTLPINPGYVLSILKTQRKKQAREDGEDAWWKTHAGIDLKGRELQMNPRPSESYDAFKIRLFSELNKRKGVERLAAQEESNA